jgi:hypothetical protein
MPLFPQNGSLKPVMLIHPWKATRRINGSMCAFVNASVPNFAPQGQCQNTSRTLKLDPGRNIAIFCSRKNGTHNDSYSKSIISQAKSEGVLDVLYSLSTLLPFPDEVLNAIFQVFSTKTMYFRLITASKYLMQEMSVMASVRLKL